MTAPSGATERSNCKTQCASLSLFTFTSSAFVLFFHFNFKSYRSLLWAGSKTETQYLSFFPGLAGSGNTERNHSRRMCGVKVSIHSEATAPANSGQ